MGEESGWMANREAAWDLLCEYTQTENLRRHALAVEAAMRHYAEKFNEDRELWGIVGLLHDFDYERFPDAESHPFEGEKILKALRYPESVRQAIMSHAPYTGVPRESLMAKTLFACDELTGFLTAAALVRPSKAIKDVAPKSVKKRMKDKAFARAVSRDDIRLGAEELGLELDEHIRNVVEAMTGIAGELGLAGVENQS